MIEIVPAILPKSFGDLEMKLASMQGLATSIQIDTVDGAFAPNKTWPYTEGSRFERIIAEEEGMPFWEDFEFEFDAMVANPKEEIPKYLRTGATRVVVHGALGRSPATGEAGIGILDTLEFLQGERAGDFGITIGVALLPGDQAGTFAQYKELCDFVQVMGIAQVGVQGSEFDARALGLITSLRETYGALTIQVDGGVKVENARAIAQAGANRLIVGSAIFNSPDPASAIEELSYAANN